MNLRQLFLISLLTLFIFFSLSWKSTRNLKENEDITVANKWSIEKAQEWSKKQPWLRGSNFTPSTAINQLETWQAESFDPVTMERELGWAESLGFNCMRVYLHHAAWEIDKDGFKKRINEYMAIADKHGIKTIFVFFDDCWNASYQTGKQPDPKPGIHNSGWVQDPGDILISQQPDIITVLEDYVKDILTSFRDDKRIVLWDLYNEPQNKSLPLVKKVFKWAREVNPSQPLSCGIQSSKGKELRTFQAANSDIITYHSYSGALGHKKMIDSLKLNNRPMICTEYMARPRSLFSTIMPMLKEQNIGAINWGLVSGKTNTIYEWDTPIPDGSEPALWFHDIFRKDGTIYKQEEGDLIKKLTGVK
jgi:hypothetical protein